MRRSHPAPGQRRSGGIKLAEDGLVKLGFLAADTPVRKRDIVTTSGLGGVYPSGLAIGEVVSVQNGEYDVSLYAEVKPFVDVNSVRDVMVITEFEGKGRRWMMPSAPALRRRASDGPL